MIEKDYTIAVGDIFFVSTIIELPRTLFTLPSGSPIDFGVSGDDIRLAASRPSKK